MTPRQELEQVVDTEHADEIIKHRQRLRKPMTPYAARLLARKLAVCPSPNDAADLMIEKGWQSIELAWITNTSRSLASIPKPTSTPSSIAANVLARMQEADTQGQQQLGFFS